MEPDLTIAGAGPAGSVAAWRAARAGLRVALYERSSLPRDRVCGEFVSAEALPLLQSIAPGLVAAAPVITHARFVAPSGRASVLALPAPARGISRLALDHALAEAAVAAGATLHARTPAPAAALIVATGRDFAPRPSPWVGVKARFDELDPNPEVELYFFRGGYCGLAPVENGWTNVCCLIHRDRAGDLRRTRDFLDWLRATLPSPALHRRLAGARQATPTVATAQVALGPRSALAPYGTDRGALLCGDASGFLDPFTGDGLARAMLSGALAADCWIEGRAHAYPAALARATGRGFRAAALIRRAASPLLPYVAAPPLARALLAATRWRAPQTR